MVDSRDLMVGGLTLQGIVLVPVAYASNRTPTILHEHGEKLRRPQTHSMIPQVSVDRSCMYFNFNPLQVRAW